MTTPISRPRVNDDLRDAPTQLFSISAYEYLKPYITSDRVVAGKITRNVFPDGERYVRINTPVRGQHVAVLGGTIDDNATLELFDLAAALTSQGARSLTLLVPYFGYSTMEREAKPGEIVTAKLRAMLLSAIPQAWENTTVVLLDLHAPGTPHYFQDHIQPVHLDARSTLKGSVLELAGGLPFVLGATDAGGAKRVQNFANMLGVEAGFVFKRRHDGSHVSFTAMHADVRGRQVVIFDDMVRTGGSLIQAARAYRSAGATKVSAVCTHGVLPPGALAKIQASGTIERLIVTDSHPRAVAQASDFLLVCTISGMFEAWLRSR
ncbi:MAG: ribose-phosphate pyrophosphokinase [Kiritimatiellia bacterium]|jgi:ribose-phosphate pyrophosphokinase